MKPLNKVVFLFIFTAFAVLVSQFVAGTTQAQSSSLQPQVNPNGARILNRTSIKIQGNEQEVVTIETIPGVVCVVARGVLASSSPAISCVRY